LPSGAVALTVHNQLEPALLIETEPHDEFISDQREPRGGLAVAIQRLLLMC
jgi:hypothetical protein